MPLSRVSQILVFLLTRSKDENEDDFDESFETQLPDGDETVIMGGEEDTSIAPPMPQQPESFELGNGYKHQSRDNINK